MKVSYSPVWRGRGGVLLMSRAELMVVLGEAKDALEDYVTKCAPH
jgi:hypothetical protein